MGKLNGLRIIEVPSFKAVSSGSIPFEKIDCDGGWSNWINTNSHLLRDCLFLGNPEFFWHEQEGHITFVLAIKDNVTAVDCAPYFFLEFKGGMYAVATADENDEKDTLEVTNEMSDWIKSSELFELDGMDGPRYGMEHMVGVGLTDVLGWAQQEIFFPIKYKIK